MSRTVLQDAVDEATSGDILSVIGICRESLTIGKSLTIRGSSKSNAVIDASSLSNVRVITMIDSGDEAGAEANPNVTLTNVTLTGGNGAGPRYGGGGAVRMSSGTLNLTGKTRLTGNTADIGGAAYCNDRGTIIMTDNAMIDRNSAIYFGGGLLVCNLSMSGQALIAANRVTGSGGGGGGVGSPQTVLMAGQSKITGNTVPSDGQGGGIYLNGGSVTLSGSASIDHNVAGQGAGIYERLDRRSQPEGVTVSQKALITSNTASGNGGGLYRDICASNTSGPAPGGVVNNRPNNVYTEERFCF